MLLNLSTCKNEYAIHNKVRAELVSLFKDFLIEKCGDPSLVSQIAANRIAATVGETTDKDGFPVDVNAIITITSPRYQDSVTKKGEPLEPFDRYQAEQDYLNDLKIEEGIPLD